jgi:predicted PurR-regulated permease PerM
MRHVGGWLTFAGFVLVVAVLYWAQAVLVPLCLAILITFVLTPPAVYLQRYVGRGVAILAVVTLVFTGVGLAGYAIYRQTVSLGDALPGYRDNIREKIRDIRGAGSNGSVEKLSRTLEEIKGDLGGAGKAPPRGTVREPVVVTSEPVAGISGIAWLGPLMEPLGTAGLVITLVLFMLLDRESLRDRLIGLFGQGHVAVTTRAMDEAGRRVSRQLLLQTLVNLAYGAIALAGLYVLGVPYPLFWGALGGGLRFIPYVGPVIAAVGPILLGLAALPGWVRPLEVAAFYVALELFTNLVLETVLYAGAAGVSEVALLVAVAFWTWLWGPLGLLMATPLTVCIIVIGKHVPGLEFLGTLLSDAPALPAESSYYQRVLARDRAEAAALVERFLASEPQEQVFDRLLLPALNFAERDRQQGRLSAAEEGAVAESTREMIELVAAAGPGEGPGPAAAACILGYPANGAADELALQMLKAVLHGVPAAFEVAGTRLLASELVTLARKTRCTALCIADLPPSAPAKTRYLVKRIRAELPDVRIAVGRWAAPELADADVQPLTDAGASHVASTLLETRKYLAEAAQAAVPQDTSHAA